MTILVTGAAGFFGSRLVGALVGRGEDVVALDRDTAGSGPDGVQAQAGRVTFVHADLADLGTIDAAHLQGVSGIVHAAAVSAAGDPDTTQVMLDTNVAGTIEALRLAARISSCGKFLFVSSAGVYDLSVPGIVCEPDATGRNSVYGATKMAAELLVREAGSALGLDVGIIRPSSLWGPSEVRRPTRPFVTPIQAMIDLARRGEAVQPRGLAARRDWLYVDDAADAAIRFLATTMGGRTCNVASGHAVPFGTVVDAIAEVFSPEIGSTGVIVDGGDDRPATICTQAIRAATGWEPTAELRTTLDAYRRYLDASFPATPGRPPIRAATLARRRST